MPGTNLTRDEAATRAALLDVTSYSIDLDLTTATDEQSTTFGSTTTIEFTATEPGASTFADLVGATIHEITLNGESVDVSAYADNRIALSGLAAENTLVVRADCTFSRTGEGLHRFVDPVDDRVYLYTQFEVPDARRVYTTFEQPDLKSVFTFNVTAPAGWTVVSNATTPEPQELGDGKALWAFPETKRMSTYITALVAGEYHEVTSVYRGATQEIPLGLYCRQSLVEHLDADDIFRTTEQGFRFFEEQFSYPYPFGKYDQLFVPEYNMGAMENAGCVTFRDEYLPRSRQDRSFYEFRVEVILHEMAHMWFGDLVTMKWWDDLWLKESFADWSATYAMSKIIEHGDEAWAMFCNGRKNWAYRADQLPTTHPIAADMVDLEAVESNFDGITYAKGASVLRQLVAYVGEEEFLAGVQRYFQAHQFGNTALGDLLGALEQASGRDLSGWSGEWLEKAGVNTLRPVVEESTAAADGRGVITRFVVEQTASPQWPTLRSHRIAIGLYDLADGELVRVGRVETDISGASTEVDALVGVTRPDLILLNDDDLTYAKIRFDARSLATLVAGLPTLVSPLTRAVGWSALWDLSRDGELSAAAYQEVALRSIGTETDPSGVQATVGQLLTAAESYTPASDRPAQVASLETGLLRLLTEAEAGSDHQLAFARGYARAAESADHLQAWLAGTDVPAGLVVDTDLRWTFVTALARLGAIDGAAIDAELERDRTIAGSQNAAAARAALPTAAAKAAAWALATDDDDIPNETQRSICSEFWQRGQEDALEGYADRYLTLVQDVSDRKNGWEARGLPLRTNAVRLLFPPVRCVPDIVETVQAWLPTARLNATVSRQVQEALADAVRARHAQQAE